MVINELVFNDFLKALLSGNRFRCSCIVRELFENKQPVDDIYELLLRRALYDVGELWETGKISVATEHLASAIVETILNDIYSENLLLNKKNKVVVVACVENENHQIGLRMVSNIYEMNGWNAFFIGEGVQMDELIRFMKTVDPDVLALSITLNSHISSLDTMIQTIRKEYPTLLIQIGGQAFRSGGYQVYQDYPNVEYISDLYHLERFLKV